METKYRECTMGDCRKQYPLVNSIIFTCDRCWCELDYDSVIRIEGGFVCGDCGAVLGEQALKNRE